MCGSDKLLLGGAYTDQPPVTAPLADRIIWWKRRGDRGTSSNTIFSAFTGASLPREGADFPYDPDDFQRCHKLLALFPEWRADLNAVTRAFPWYAPFVDRWTEMEALWVEESPSKRFPKLYDLMKMAEAESRKLREKKVK